MTILSEVAFWKRRQDLEERTLTTGNAAPLLMNSGHEWQTPGPSGALTIADAYACIRALSDAAASLPLRVYRKRPEGRERVSTGRAATLLSRPAAGTTTANLIAQTVTHLQLYGNAYIGKVREEHGTIVQLTLIHPDSVTPELKGGRLTFEVTTDQGMVTCTEADIIHIRGLSVDGLTGLSPVAQARQTLRLSKALTDHATATFENGAQLGGVLKVDAQGDAVERLSKSWQQSHGGPSNAGKIAILSGDIDFKPLTMPLADAEFLEQRRYSAAEVARIFRVPPWIVGADNGSSPLTYSTVEGQAQHFVTFSLRPWLVLIEQAISNDTDLCPAGLYVEFLLDGLLRADSKTRAEVYQMALDPETGWLTRGEVRALENLDQEAPNE